METTTSTVGSCSSPRVVLWQSTSCECDELTVKMFCLVLFLNSFVCFLSRMILILHQSGTSHGHSHSFPTGQLRQEHDQHRHGHHHGNASVKAAFIHVVGDLVQSVGVLLAATIIRFWVSVGKTLTVSTSAAQLTKTSVSTSANFTQGPLTRLSGLHL